METMYISLREFERIKDKGLVVVDIHGQIMLIIGDIAFIAVTTDEDQQNGIKEETIKEEINLI